jgi:hypothetical protein
MPGGITGAHPKLSAGTSCALRSSVPRAAFDALVDSLKAEQKTSATAGNAISPWFLAKEVFLSEIVAECATLPVQVDQLADLCERVSEVERWIPSFSNPPRQLEDEIESQERGLETLRLALEKLEEEVAQLVGLLDTPKSVPTLPASQEPFAGPALSASLSASGSRARLSFR